MFNFSEANRLLGFRVRESEEVVPGLHAWRPKEEIQGLHAWKPKEAPGRHGWMPQEGVIGFYLGRPAVDVRRLDLAPDDLIRAATDRDVAWSKCHARCADQTVGRGLPDSFIAYRRCMRACLNSMGIFDY